MLVEIKNIKEPFLHEDYKVLSNAKVSIFVVNFEVMVFGKNGHLVMLVKFFHLC
jgi:hypothetical protein